MIKSSVEAKTLKDANSQFNKLLFEYDLDHMRIILFTCIT